MHKSKDLNNPEGSRAGRRVVHNGEHMTVDHYCCCLKLLTARAGQTGFSSAKFYLVLLGGKGTSARLLMLT